MRKVLLSATIIAGLFINSSAQADQFKKGSEFKADNTRVLVISGIRAADEGLSRYLIGWGLYDMATGKKTKKKL